MTLRPTPLVARRPTALHTHLRATARAARAACGGDGWARPEGWQVNAIALVLLGLMPWSDVLGQTARVGLPSVCSIAAAACGGRTFVDPASAARHVTVTTNGNTMTVQQNANTSLLNWANFNIANGNTVAFTHINPTQAFTAINRIHDTSISTIDGRITAPMGQIYLINPNGLLFGNNARVDVASLIASTLGISDVRAQRGLLNGDVRSAVFSIDPNSPEALASGVDVSPGAIIQAGNVYVFAPNVENSGSIQVTPGGQVVLAAGQQVFLTSSDSATLRGLLVEVGQGGTVTNSGSIVTPRGNTTLVGMAVNQSGSITATSALTYNGSVYLRAREVASGTGTSAEPINRAAGAAFTATPFQVAATGNVTVAAGSSTQVLLDATDTSSAALSDAGAKAARSTIVVDGRTVSLGEGNPALTTLLRAKGGDITLSARGAASHNSTDRAVLGTEDAGATLRVADRVTLDVSGERRALVDGARNHVRIDRLTSNDLRDAPGQRDGFLRGETVHVNLAQDHAFIDLSARRDAVAGTQAERNATAGTIALRAEGRVDVARDAVLNVSGGSTQVTQAKVRTSQLLTRDGRVVDVMQAKATEEYVGFADRVTVAVNAPREGINTVTTYDAPRFTAVGGYEEGKSAGTVEITAPRGSMAGRIDAQVVRGEHQRTDASLRGGSLRIGSTGAEALSGSARTGLEQQASILRASVLLSDNPAAGAGSGQDRLITLDTSMLRRSGVQHLSVTSDGQITVAASSPLDMGARGSVALTANAVQVDADLVARGGNITLSEIKNTNYQPLIGEMHVGTGVTLDASGTFSNDLTHPQGANRSTPVVLDGGKVSITGREVDVSRVAAIRVDAGARVGTSGGVTGGKAGSVTLEATRVSSLVGDAEADTGQLLLGEGFAQRLSAFGFSEGGNLTLKAPRITVGAEARAGELQVDAAYFARGFEDFTFTGNDGISVQGGQTLAPRVDRFVADVTLRRAADGGRLAQVATPEASLPLQERPVEMTLKAGRTLADVVVETDAVADAGAGGKVTLEAGRAVLIDGTLRAAGGTVKASLASRESSSGDYLDAWSVGFAAQHALHLGDNAHLDVSGMPRILADGRGRLSGQVQDGGQVVLNAADGHLAVATGARIAADGTRGEVDLLNNGVPTRTELASRGGAVSFSAMQSLQVNGEVSARAGAAGVEGGRLSVQFTGLAQGSYNKHAKPDAVASPVFDDSFRPDRVLTLGGAPGALPGLGEALVAGAHAGRGHVSTGLINDSGFDTVWLASANTLAVTPAAGQPTMVTLTPRGSLTLDAQALRIAPGATLAISSPGTVVLGDQQGALTFASNQNGNASGGSGQLWVEARHVDVVGDSVLQGVGLARIAARDDVRLRGIDESNTRLMGSLEVGGDVHITAAQLTPATQTDFRIASTGEGARIAVAPTQGSTPLEPLSAAGSVTLRAPQIEVTGRISAPHGGIDLDAGQSLRVGPQAVLSVAGTQAVPYGAVFNNGAQWAYSDTAYDPTVSGSVDRRIASADGTQVKEKRIRLNGPSVDVDPQARLDLRGGGDLVAQEFTPGPGGSRDVRLNCVGGPCDGDGDVRNTLFALMPARGDHAAPFDPMIQSDLTQNAALGGSQLMRVGQTITLAEGSGLPAGTYTLMPARYAVLPGAYAVQAVPGYADMTPGARVLEVGGIPVVAGRLGIDGAGLSNTRWSGYRVLDGAQFRKLSELQDHSANSYFPLMASLAGEAAPRAPLDAGALSVSAGEALRLSTESILAGAATARVSGVVQTGRGAEIALRAPRIEVNDAPADTQTAPGPSARLSLGGQALSDLQAETLVLGAGVTRGDGNAAQRGTLTLGTEADQVSLTGTQTVQAGEVLLAARGVVDVRADASVASDARQAPVTTEVMTNGNGATLHISQAAEPVRITRKGQTGESGELRVGERARLSGRSASFGASQSQTYASTINLDVQVLGLAATNVHFGNSPTDAQGLRLTTELLGQFAHIGSLALQSDAGFDVHGNVQVGGSGMRSLTLDGDGIYGRTAGASATLTAGDVTLRRSATGSAQATPAATGTGTLTVQARGGEGSVGNVGFGGGNFAMQGFARQQITATGQPEANGSSRAGTGQIRFSGTGSLTTQGELTLDAARITAGRAANHTVTAQGLLHTQANSAASTDTSTELGATLSFNGQRVEHGGRIELPSGRVSLQATGTGAQDDVTLLSGSRLSVAGSTQHFANQTADASAGQATLSATAGSVRLRAGSEIDLSGAGTDGDAGALALAATQGTLQLDGRIHTAVNTAADSVALRADISADARTLSDLNTLARAFEGGPGLQTLDVRVREGDTTLAEGHTLKAKNIRIAVDGARSEAAGATARDGQLTIAGTLDASGTRGGRIELHAGERITLGASARLDAHSSGEGHEGGAVLVSSRIQTQPDTAARDAIQIVQGAQVDVSGLNGGPATGLSAADQAARNANWGGTITLRAPRVGNDVAIRGVGAAGEALPTDYLKGARQEIVEATVVSDQGSATLTLNPSATTGVLATQRQALQTYMGTANRNAMATRLGRSGTAGQGLHLRPGLELRTTGDITVSGALDFTSQSAGVFNWRYGGSTLDTSQPGALTLRAGGNLTLTGGLQDGFTLTGTLNTIGGRLLPFERADSWRYQLSGGADLSGAAASAVRPLSALATTAGNVVFNGTGVPQTRTGTGRIDVAAGRDIKLEGTTTSVFTGGAASVVGPAYGSTVVRDLRPTFTRHGGDVSFTAGRDITANSAPRQLVNNWLWRAGRSVDGGFDSAASVPTAWWVNAATFTEGVGALGGGDLAVKAGRDVTYLNAVVPSNAFLDTTSNPTLVEHNLGDVSVQAGGTLTGGLVYSQAGEINLRAAKTATTQNLGSNAVVVAQGNNDARVQTQGDALILGSFNPTWAATLSRQEADSPAFSTYGDASAFSVRSLTGDISLGGDFKQRTGTGNIQNVLLAANTDNRALAFTILPARADLVSFGGDIAVVKSRLAPAPDGQLRLLADGNVSGEKVVMMDLDPGLAGVSSDSSMPTAFAPVPLNVMQNRASPAQPYSGENLDATNRHAAINGRSLHADDPNPVAVVARTGSLLGLSLDVPKPIEITVAGDITGPTRISAQNVSEASVSRIHAGGRIDASKLPAAAPIIQISGPGVAEVLAGGDIDLARSSGIVTRGNLYNPVLPEAGATLVVAAGVGQGDDGFARRPDYSGVVNGFLQRDAYASAGGASTGLNTIVLGETSWAKVLGEGDADHVLDRARLRALIPTSALSDDALNALTDPAAPNRAQRAAQAAQWVWNEALRNRSAAGSTSADDAFAWAQGLSEASRMRLGVELTQQVQAVSNLRFVQTGNTESFAPGYGVLRDLFPTLSSDAKALRHFVANNPFKVADNAAALRAEVLAGLPEPVAALLALGIAQPAQLDDPTSAFNRGLAALDAATLHDAGTRLMGQTQRVAGVALDALRVSNRVDAGVGTPFATGLDALASAFAPAGPVGQNGISLTQSQIRTEQSGDMALFTPRGGVLLGLTAEKTGDSKTDDQLGLLSFGGGSILGLVRDNFDVNKSRVFTVAGGDVHLWSSQGNVDAGRGPVDAKVAPPPRLKIDSATGEVSVDVSASVSGSGIGALTTKDDQPVSDIRLIAPKGYVDAGEAGIRAPGGKVFIGSTIVLNAGNISAGGGVSGGAVVTPPPAPLPQAATNTGSAEKALEKADRALTADQIDAEEKAKKARRKRVTGEFIGFGDD